MTKQLSDTIINKLKNFYGTIKPGLTYQNVYQLIISVVLSAQTTDKQVNKITPVLFGKYPNFEVLSKAKYSEVENIIKSCGFYTTKARNIVNLSKKIITDFNNTPPNERDQLMTLPGVGRKSANVILSQGFNIPAFAVDTHVIRLSNRLGYTTTKNPLKIEQALISVIDKDLWSDSHLLFIHHGRNICKAQNPQCSQCPIYNECAFSDKTV